VSERPEMEQILGALLTVPRTVEEAVRPEGDGGLPASGGLYAWWADGGSLPGVPRRPHPTAKDFDLFYVGISPVRNGSDATLRTRIIRNHLRGNIGGSTFRFTLAALLLDEIRLKPIQPSNRPFLNKADNAKLSAWQRTHLNLTWCAHSEPWKVELGVVAELEPPLNLAGNSTHSFHATLSKARAHLRQVAQGAGRGEGPVWG
jgi:hypothetical protein